MDFALTASPNCYTTILRICHMDHVSKDDVSRVSYTIHELQLTWLGHSQSSLSTCMLCITQNMIPSKRGLTITTLQGWSCKPQKRSVEQPRTEAWRQLVAHWCAVKCWWTLASVVKPLQSSPTLVFYSYFILLQYAACRYTLALRILWSYTIQHLYVCLCSFHS